MMAYAADEYAVPDVGHSKVTRPPELLKKQASFKYVGALGEEIGPVTAKELAQLLRSGQISDKTLVRDEGAEELRQRATGQAPASLH